METFPLANNTESEPGDESSQLQAGSLLENRYQIQGVLGIGGMGAVYRARDMHFPNVTKIVAVKEMVNRALDPIVRNTIVRNFEREANLLASLDHRAIPRIYDYFTLHERSYLVLEFINGQNLEALINSHNEFLPVDRVLRWAIELCDVLNFLHSHKPEAIIFRDMKPSNVMVTPQDHSVLIDFGIAKHFQTGQKGTMVGTEGYSPPEQYRGEATPSADIYSLGATLHHVLTKRDPRLEPPFSFGERLIRQINPDVPLELESAINKALQYNPDDRYNSANELKEILLSVAREAGLQSHIPADITKSRSHKTGIKPIWEFKCEDEIRGSPIYNEGVIYVGCYDNNLYALNAEDGSFLWKYPTEGGIVSKPVVYSDSIIFGSEDHGLYSLFKRNGKLNWVYHTDGAVRSSPHLTEGHIFIGSDDGFLHVVNADTGRRAWHVDCGAPIRSTPATENSRVFIGTESGDFFCIDYTSAVRWRFKAKRAVISSPQLSENIVFLGSVDSNLYALNANTGWVIWRNWFGKPLVSTPWIEDNLLFIGCVDGAIYSLDVNSAKEIWRFPTQHQVTGSPTIYKDSLYCGSVDGHLYCLEFQSGRMRWTFRTDGPITGTPIVIDETVYIGSTDHKFYALMA